MNPFWILLEFSHLVYPSLVFENHLTLVKPFQHVEAIASIKAL